MSPYMGAFVRWIIMPPVLGALMSVAFGWDLTLSIVSGVAAAGFVAETTRKRETP